MQFKHIVNFTLKEFNKNKEKDGYIPQNGTVITVYHNSTYMTDFVAVGYTR